MPPPCCELPLCAPRGLLPQEQQLLDYLTSGRDLAGRPLYDPVHALRLARDRGCLRASVALFCEVRWAGSSRHMGLHCVLGLCSFGPDLCVGMYSASAAVLGLFCSVGRYVWPASLPRCLALLQPEKTWLPGLLRRSACTRMQ